MSDGIVCPSLHDGMAVVDQQGNSGRLILVRNHETAVGSPYLGKPSIMFAGDGAGGTTNLIFNGKTGNWEKSWSTLGRHDRDLRRRGHAVGHVDHVGGNHHCRSRLEL